MKKLITTAVAAAIFAPVVAMASGPVLYGKVHLDVSYKDVDTRAIGGNINVTSNSSRVGVKGSEDLGNGLKAVYNFEWSVNVAANSGVGGRHSYGGIGGGFGTVLVGRLSTPTKVIGRKTDLLGDRLGSTRSVYQAGVEVHDDNTYLPNTIAYASPKFGGISTTLAYSADAGAGSGNDNNDRDAYSGNLVYANGPVYAGIGYSKLSKDIFGGTDDQTLLRFAGSFKMAGARIVGAYSMTDDNQGVNGAELDSWHLGGAYTFGTNTAKLQYVASSQNSGAAGAGDVDSSIITIALDHKMSKRTMAYVQYSLADNDTGGIVTPWSGGGDGHTGSGISGQDADAFTVGLVHKF